MSKMMWILVFGKIYIGVFSTQENCESLADKLHGYAIDAICYSVQFIK
jgi:hypothetical protein